MSFSIIAFDITNLSLTDPIRTFFIKTHIDHAFNLKENTVYKWFRSQATEFLPFGGRRAEQVSLNAVWDDR